VPFGILTSEFFQSPHEVHDGFFTDSQ
jgi:hypothetical protein